MIRMSAKSVEFETQTTELNDDGIPIIILWMYFILEKSIKTKFNTSTLLISYSFLDYERKKLENFLEYQITPTVDALNRKESLIRFEEDKNDLITNVVGN